MESLGKQAPHGTALIAERAALSVSVRAQREAQPDQPHVADPDRGREQPGRDGVLPGQAAGVHLQGKDAEEGHLLPRHLGQGARASPRRTCLPVPGSLASSSCSLQELAPKGLASCAPRDSTLRRTHLVLVSVAAVRVEGLRA